MSALTDPWIPRGLLSEAHLTANTALNVTTSATITGTVQTDNGTAAAGTLRVVVGVLAGRRYRVRLIGSVFSDVSGDNGGLSITNSGAAGSLYQNGCRLYLPTSSAAYPGVIEGVFYPSATASATFTATLLRVSGTGHIDAQSGMKITAEDVGLAP